MQMAQRKWRVRRLGLGFVIALRCAICIAPNTESLLQQLHREAKHNSPFPKTFLQMF